MTPLEVSAIVVASAAAFVGTGLDNLLLLVAFKAAGSRTRWSVRLGYLLAVVVAAFTAMALASSAQEVLPFPLAYLGVLPIAAGLYHGARAWRGASSDGSAESEPPRSGFVGVFATMLANSGDSVLVLVALFGDTRSRLDWIVLGTVLALGVLWLRIAAGVAGHPRLRGRVEGAARFLLPIVLIALGIYILLDTPTDVLQR